MSSNVSFKTFHNVINGQLRTSPSNYYGINPANGENLWPVPMATREDVEEAVEAACVAFERWSKKSFEERSKHVRAFSEACKEHIPNLAELLVSETGKPRWSAMGETHSACAEAFEYFLGLTLPGIDSSIEDRDYHMRYVPIGVVAAILPWNYPISQVTLKALPAMLAGNCVIVKPSPFAPYTALKLVEIAQKALPPGVLQVLGGDDNLGPWLVDHERIDKVSFTGSSATGKQIMASAARTLKRLTLELGGNDAAIVCDDVDIQETAKELLMGALYNAGQVCATTKRIYAHRDIHAELVKAMSAVANSLKIGDPIEEDTYAGPLQNESQFTKVKRLSEDSKAYVYGKVPELFCNPRGYFMPPTIINNPPEDSRIMKEEQFGPIIPVQIWTEEDDVIRRANATNMGLGASVWSRDLEQATRIAEQLEAGSIFINSAEKLTFKIPFGGHKESGLGMEGGSSALIAYCNSQVIHYVRK